MSAFSWSGKYGTNIKSSKIELAISYAMPIDLNFCICTLEGGIFIQRFRFVYIGSIHGTVLCSVGVIGFVLQALTFCFLNYIFPLLFQLCSY